MKIWIDGKFLAKDEATVSVFDHGLLYGDGVFEGIRFYNKKVFKLKEHVDRLFYSARYIMLEIGMTPEQVSQAIEDTVAADELVDGYIRVVVSRGPGNLGLNPFLCPKSCLIIIVDSIALYPKEHYENGLAIITSSTRRPTPAALCPQVKSLNYLNNIMAKVEAVRAGVLEALMLNEQGYVAECTGDNIFIVKNGTVYTPLVSDGCLDGITRRAVLDICQELGIPAIERTLNSYDIMSADECFLTGTAAEVIPVTKLDGKELGSGKPGETTLRILARYREITSSL